MTRLNILLRHRFGPVFLQLLLIVMVSFSTRVVLLVKSWPQMHIGFFHFFGVFLVGAFYDIVSGLYFSIPLILYCLLMPDRLYRKRWQRFLLYGYFLIAIYLLLFNAVSEYFFWQEFSVRYNFIAVDYLVYTTEVIGNIRQSYPLTTILICLLAITILVFLPLKKNIRYSQEKRSRFLRRLPLAIALLLLAAINFWLVKDSFRLISRDKYVNELAGNGLYQFGAAFRKNELDYSEFYVTRNQKQVFETARRLMKTPEAEFVENAANPIERIIHHQGEQNKWNLVLISIESLSAEYLKYFGNDGAYIYQQIGYKGPITPVLDSLIPKSVFFSNFYATGTRTVRGLEALSLSMPPTPGQSVVKRLPTRHDLFSVGNLLRSKGYDCKYIYGGNSFFDNMGDYFSENGYTVVDKDAIPKKAIHHETAWGVADEDLFTLALDEMDKSFKSGKLFFNHIMTVSNHRPYTYPKGRVAISPDYQVREGALLYTDYCIGKFLREARSKPWFKNTLFVIVADHCAQSAGHSDLPLNRYHIPCWIYAPALVQPAVVTRLTSQIDLVPTMLGLLNMEYRSKFYGYDIFKLEEGRERLFLVNYQDVGYVRNGKMVVLSPNKKIAMYKPDFNTGDVQPIPLEDSLVNEAISCYQSASYLLSHGLYGK